MDSLADIAHQTGHLPMEDDVDAQQTTDAYTEFDPPKPKNLDQKLLEVSRALGALEKTGRNDAQGYAYVEHSHVVSAVRKELNKWGIRLQSSILSHETQERQGRKGSLLLSVVHMEMVFVDVDTSDRRTHTWVGTAMDTGDKGLYKAYTGAIKYFLLDQFLLPTGADPEADTSVDDATRETIGDAAPVTESGPPKDKVATAPKPSFTYDTRLWDDDIYGVVDMSVKKQGETNDGRQWTIWKIVLIDKERTKVVCERFGDKALTQLRDYWQNGTPIRPVLEVATNRDGEPQPRWAKKLVDFDPVPEVEGENVPF